MNYNCPHCSTLLPVTPDQTEITCPCCLTVLEVSTVTPPSPPSPAPAPPANLAATSVPDPLPEIEEKTHSTATTAPGGFLFGLTIVIIIGCTVYLGSKISDLQSLIRSIKAAEKQRMDKPVEYEYQIRFLPDESGPSTSLWLSSKSGWELVTARRANDSENEKWGYECILRKKVSN